MISPRCKFYVEVGFDFLRFLASKVSCEGFKLYLIMRSFVWRGKKGALAAHYADGLLCCSIPQRKLAEMVGISRNTTLSVLKELIGLEWVKSQVRDDKPFGELLYVLGKRHRSLSGGYAGEDFFADLWVARQIEELERSGKTQLQGVIDPRESVVEEDVQTLGKGCQQSGQPLPTTLAGHVQNLGTRSREGEVDKQRREVESLAPEGARAVPADELAEKPRAACSSNQGLPATNKSSFSKAKAFTDQQRRIYGRYQRVSKDHLGFTPGPACPKDIKLLQELIRDPQLQGEKGTELAFEMVDCMVYDWSAIKGIRKLFKQVPDIGVLCMLRDELKHAVQTGRGYVDLQHRSSPWAAKYRQANAVELDRRIDDDVQRFGWASL